jgi:hypothetical protein
MFYFLNIPPLEKDLELSIIEDYDQSIIDLQPIIFNNESKNYIKRSINKFISLINVTKLTKWLYPYVGFCYFNIIHLEPNEEIPAIFPAHTDLLRNTAINLILIKGGENVETTIYHPPKDHERGIVKFWYENTELKIIDSQIIPSSKWWVFDAQLPHSVKNIESKRLILAATPVSNIRLEEFLIKFEKYIVL